MIVSMLNGRVINAAAVAGRALPAAAAASSRMQLAPRHNQQLGRRHATTEAAAADTDNAAGEGPAQGNNIYAAFTVYKKQGALTVKPIKPTWDSAPGGYKIGREGTFFFEMANPSSTAAQGERRYEWDKKVSFALAPIEAATILAAPDQSHQFYHDTYKNQPGREGSVTKTIKWSMAPDGKAYFLNASLSDKIQNIENKASVSLTPGEFYLLRQLINSSIMYLMGWDAALTGQ